MVRERAKSKAFGEGVVEASRDEKTYKLGSLSFDEVRKVVPRLADEFRTDLEAIANAPEQTKRGITEALTKDLQGKVTQAKGIVDAWFIMKESELAGLLGESKQSKPFDSLRELRELYTRTAQSPKLGSLHDRDVKKVIPNLERYFQTIQTDVEKKIPEMGVSEVRAFVQEKVADLALELQRAKEMLTAWFATLTDEIPSIHAAADTARARGSVIAEQASSVHAKAAELLRGQAPARGTAPLEARGTALLVEGEFDIESGKVTLQNLIGTLTDSVMKGPKSGGEFLSFIQTQYELFKRTTKEYFDLHEAIISRYRGQHVQDALRELGYSAIDLKHLVGGIKAHMALSGSLKSEMGTANVAIIEERIRPIKDELDQLWFDIDRTIGSGSPAMWKGSRRLLPHPKTGK